MKCLFGPILLVGVITAVFPQGDSMVDRDRILVDRPGFNHNSAIKIAFVDELLREDGRGGWMLDQIAHSEEFVLPMESLEELAYYCEEHRRELSKLALSSVGNFSLKGMDLFPQLTELTLHGVNDQYNQGIIHYELLFPSDNLIRLELVGFYSHTYKDLQGLDSLEELVIGPLNDLYILRRLPESVRTVQFYWDNEHLTQVEVDRFLEEMAHDSVVFQVRRDL